MFPVAPVAPVGPGMPVAPVGPVAPEAPSTDPHVAVVDEAPCAVFEVGNFVGVGVSVVARILL